MIENAADTPGSLAIASRQVQGYAIKMFEIDSEIVENGHIGWRYDYG
jgi:hypothetical protein